jgi:hypothetical protein
MMEAEDSSETSVRIFDTIYSRKQFSSLLRPREPQISLVFWIYCFSFL